MERETVGGLCSVAENILSYEGILKLYDVSLARYNIRLGHAPSPREYFRSLVVVYARSGNEGIKTVDLMPTSQAPGHQFRCRIRTWICA
jgi:hypothetical protein